MPPTDMLRPEEIADRLRLLPRERVRVESGFPRGTHMVVGSAPMYREAEVIPSFPRTPSRRLRLKYPIGPSGIGLPTSRTVIGIDGYEDLGEEADTLYRISWSRRRKLGKVSVERFVPIHRSEKVGYETIAARGLWGYMRRKNDVMQRRTKEVEQDDESQHLLSDEWARRVEQSHAYWRKYTLDQMVDDEIDGAFGGPPRARDQQARDPSRPIRDAVLQDTIDIQDAVTAPQDETWLVGLRDPLQAFRQAVQRALRR